MKKLILTAYTEIDLSIVEYELTNIEASKNDVSSVVLNTETTSILQNTFKDFSNLSIVYNIEKVTSIYDNAFENTALTGNLTLNKNTTLIGKHAFKGTKIVRAIVDKATSIGEGAFENCSELTSTNLNANLTSLQKDTFKNCINLIKIYGDLKNITSFGDSVFENCPISSNINQNLTLNTVTKTIGKYAFKGTKFVRAIVDRATSIGEGAFENCSELTSTNLNANDKIGLNNNVFKNCLNLKTIYNTNCISSIGDYTFASCYNFPQLITLPECTEIGRYAFLSCENLSNLTARKCTFVDYNAFYGTKLWDIEPSEV